MTKKFVISSILFAFCLLLTTPVSGEKSNSNEQSSESDDEINLASDAKSAILMENDTGTVLYENNSHKKLPPASMTKIMTLLLIMEAIDNEEIALDEMVRISENASSMGGSQVFLKEGEEMSVKDLLKSVAVASGNDASVALAERVAGTEEAFVNMMNDKAESLNLSDTHFENTTGLPAKGHHSSAHDLAVMSKALLEHESITDYTSIYEDYLRKGEENEFWLVNTNRLVNIYDEVDGLKTGFTDEAKYSLTATAEKNNMRVINVVMGAESPKKRNSQTSDMLDYAFDHFETKKLFEKGDQITSLRLLKANESDIKVVTSSPVSILHQTGENTDNITTSVKMDKDIQAPIKKGEQVGNLLVKDENETLSETPLVVDKDIDEATFFTLFKRNLQHIIKQR